MVSNYKTVKKDFLSAKIKGCKKFFAAHDYKLEQAYCELILDDLKKSRQLFKEIEDEDIRAHWGLILLDFIKGTVREAPKYFEIRNFLEIDLNLLIMYCKGDYVEKIIRYADFMYTVNPEVHKFIGRVFLNNRMKQQAMFFFNRAKDYFYKDPELHYILAEIAYKDGNIQLAKETLQVCLQILPEYYPASALIQKI